MALVFDRYDRGSGFLDEFWIGRVKRGRMSMMRPQQNQLTGIILRLTAVACISLMMALVKIGHLAGVSTLELAFYRYALGLPPLFVWIAATRNFGAWRTARLSAHLWRAGLGLATMMLTFAALRYMPLAEATTISFAAPFLTVFLSALLLKEQVGRHRWAAVTLGFLGVLVVMQPQGSALPPTGLLFAALAAAGAALLTVAIRQIGRTEGTQTIVFWYGLLTTLTLGLFMPFYCQFHDSQTWLVIVALGMIGSVGGICFTASLRYAPVSVLVPFDYFQLLGAVLLGWSVFANKPLATTWAGAAIIIVSGLYTLYREHRLGRDKLADGAPF